MDDELELVLGKLDGVRARSGYWTALCPGHDDSTASLSIARGTDQPVVLTCHAGCERDAILAAIGLTLADISKPRSGPDPGEWTPAGPAIAVYDYTDENGRLLYQVCRTAGKEFPQRRPDPTTKSGWRWTTRGIRKVPYRLPRLIAAVTAGQTVYICEGEKDVHSLERAGATATSAPGGAKAPWDPAWNTWFAGATVIIIADRDTAGREHAADIAAHLKTTAASVTIAEAATGKDATDHLAAGHTLAELVPFRPASRALAVIDLEPAAEHVTPPVLICGDLLYRGAVHTLSGPPDSGKTTLACWWMLQSLRDDGGVLFLDEEGGREIVTERFQALGAAAGERIGYVAFPARAWNADDIATLAAVLDERRPAVVAWDSSAAFLARAGLDENAAADVTRFYTQVLTLAARRHGAAVLVIDHDTKNGEPSRYARGSGAKLATVDVAFKIVPVKAFSKTESGTSRLLVAKDRRGWLHRFHQVAFDVSPAADVALKVALTEAAAAQASLTPAQEKIRGVLDTIPRPVPEITDRVKAAHGHGLYPSTVRKALARLAELGLARCAGTSENLAQLWRIPDVELWL